MDKGSPTVEGTLAAQDLVSNHPRSASPPTDTPIDVHVRALPGQRTDPCASESHNLVVTLPPLPPRSPVQPPAGAVTSDLERRSGIADQSHDPVPPRTLPSGSLSARPSFRSFSSEEGEVHDSETRGRESGPGLPTGRKGGAPSLPRSECPTPFFPPRDNDTHNDVHRADTPITLRFISAHGSFQDFSDEEMEETQSASRDGDQPMDQVHPIHPLGDRELDQPSTGHRNPTLEAPNIFIPPFYSESGSSSLVSALRGRGPRNTLKRYASVDKRRRHKFSAGPFTPQHHRYTPRERTAGHAQGFPSFPPTLAGATPTQTPRPGPSRYGERSPSNSLDHDEEMADLEFATSDTPPTKPDERAGAVRLSVSGPSPAPQIDFPQQTYGGDPGFAPQPSQASCSIAFVSSFSKLIHRKIKLHSPCVYAEHVPPSSDLREGKREGG